VTYVLVGAVGFLIGLAAHDVALHALSDSTPLRPLIGTCRSCGQRRGWLRPKCPDCGTVVGREPIVALAAAAVAIGFLQTLGTGLPLVAYLGFLGLSLALIVTDLEAFRIVDRLNLRGTVLLLLLLTLVTALEGRWGPLFRGAGGAAIYFAGASLVFLAVRGRGFGAGDVKLAVQLGLFTSYLGWSVLGWAVFATALIGGVIALLMILSGAAGRKTELPYGPPMVMGAWTAIVMVGVGAIPIPS